MREAPFLKFYTSDWRSGTLGLSFELKGFYMDLLALMWDRQSRLPSDPKLIAQWLQVDPRKVKRLMGELITAGKIFEAGTQIANKRLDHELAEHKTRSDTAKSRESSKRLPPELLPEVHADFSEKSDINKSKNPTKSTNDGPSIRSYKLEVRKNTPLTPQGGQKAQPEKSFDWNTAFEDPHAAGVAIVNDRIVLSNGTRQHWLERFGGDEDRLELAVDQAAGYIQPNSKRPIESQLASQLARIAGQMRDSDRRYEKAASTNTRFDPHDKAEVARAREILNRF